MSSTVNVIILLFLSVHYIYSEGRSETYCISELVLAMRKIMMAMASLLTNAFKTVQPSAKDKEDTYRRADARQGYLTQDFTL